MNLNETFPRGPREKIGGLVFIPRMIDKARAYNQNALGEYIFPCPMDKIILEFLNIDEQEWARLVDSKNEKQISVWIENKIRSFPPEEIAAVNKKILERKPDNEDRRKHFCELRDNIDSSRTDITTWAGLMDLEEGRIVPK